MYKIWQYKLKTQWHIYIGLISDEINVGFGIHWCKNKIDTDSPIFFSELNLFILCIGIYYGTKI